MANPSFSISQMMAGNNTYQDTASRLLKTVYTTLAHATEHTSTNTLDVLYTKDAILTLDEANSSEEAEVHGAAIPEFIVRKLHGTKFASRQMDALPGHPDGIVVVNDTGIAQLPSFATQRYLHTVVLYQHGADWQIRNEALRLLPPVKSVHPVKPVELVESVKSVKPVKPAVQPVAAERVVVPKEEVESPVEKPTSPEAAEVPKSWASLASNWSGPPRQTPPREKPTPRPPSAAPVTVNGTERPKPVSQPRPRRSGGKDECEVFVRGWARSITKEEVKRFMEDEFGPVVDITIPFIDREFGYVEFATVEDARKAIESGQATIQGRQLRIVEKRRRD